MSAALDSAASDFAYGPDGGRLCKVSGAGARVTWHPGGDLAFEDNATLPDAASLSVHPHVLRRDGALDTTSP